MLVNLPPSRARCVVRRGMQPGSPRGSCREARSCTPGENSFTFLSPAALVIQGHLHATGPLYPELSAPFPAEGRALWALKQRVVTLEPNTTNPASRQNPPGEGRWRNTGKCMKHRALSAGRAASEPGQIVPAFHQPPPWLLPGQRGGQRQGCRPDTLG